FTFIVQTHRYGSPVKRASMWAGLCAIAATSVAEPFLAAAVNSPRPALLNHPGSSLATEFVVRGTYKDDQHAARSYELAVTDQLNARNNRIYTSKAPYVAIPQRGRLGLRVRAVSNRWRSDFSDEVSVDVYDDSISRIRATKQLVVALHPDNS